MKEDTKDILKELEKELLAVRETEEITEDALLEEVLSDEALLEEILLEEGLTDEALLEEILAEEGLMKEALSEPAFEDPDYIGDPEEPGVFRNFSNGYGEDLPEEKEKGAMSRGDKINVGLMIANSALCLGIIGVLVYWLVKFL